MPLEQLRDGRFMIRGLRNRDEALSRAQKLRAEGQKKISIGGSKRTGYYVSYTVKDWNG